MKKSIIRCLGFVLAFFPLWSPSVFALEFPFLYKGIRPLGMGNTFVTISDDHNALFYNPAGLSQIEGFGGAEILNPMLEISKDARDAISDIQDVEAGDLAGATAILQQHMGERFHARTSLLPNAVFHNWGFGVLAQATVDGEIHNPVTPEVTIDGKLDLGAVAGLAHGFMEQSLQLGISGKFIQRDQYLHTYTAAEVSSPDFDPSQDFEDNREKETAFGVDVGGLYHFTDVRLQPTIGLVIQNIGDMDLGQSEIPQMVNVGAAIHPNFWILKNTLALDINDLLKNVEGEDDFYKRIHMGGEFKFPSIVTVRAGLNQGYPTFGLGIDFWIMEINYAFYTEEIGVVSGQKADDIHVVQLALGF